MVIDKHNRLDAPILDKQAPELIRTNRTKLDAKLIAETLKA